MLIGQLAIMVTVVGWLVFVVLTLTRSSITGAPGRPALDLATIGYLVIMSLLACSALAYLITRLGYYSRTRSHRRATRAELSQPFERSAPSLTVLIPSYQEDERVIRMTVLSAALQEYPDLGVVLLIDDPPEPKYAKPAAMLAAAKRLPGDIEALLAVPMGRFERALADWDEHFKTAGKPTVDDISTVASHYEFAATWMATYASDYEIVDHADRFLVEQVLRGLAADLTTNARGPACRRRRRRRADPQPPALPAPATDLDLRREDHQLPAQALRLAVARAQQGDEPEQLHRAHGRQLPRGGRPRRRPCTAAHRRRARPRGPQPRLRPHPGRRQPPAAGVLPADRAPAPAGRARARRGRPGAVHVLPGRGDPPRAHRRRDDRPAVHGPSGDDPLRRDVLGRRQRGPAQARDRRPARGLPRRRLGDQPLHLRPHGHRGHGVEHRPRRPRLAAAQLPRAAQLQRHAAGLRLADHPAPALGERRPAHPAAPVAPDPRPTPARRAPALRRDVPARELHGVDRVELDRPDLPAGLPVQRQAHQPGRPADLDPLLRDDGDRPAPLRLPQARRARDLRLQPDPAARQPRRSRRLDGPAPDRRTACVQAHAEGAQPHHAGLHVRGHALRVRRLLGGGADQRRLPRPLGQRGAGRHQRRTRRLRDRRLHRRRQLDRRHLQQRRQLAVQAAARAAGQARRTPRGGAHHRRRRARRALVADARLRLGGRRAPGRAPPLLASRREPGDRRSPLGDRRAAVRAPEGHDRQDTIAAHTPAPESRDQR